jgi:hypothetical protein
MTMTGRFVHHGIRILAAIVLLLAVLSSPIRPTIASQINPPPNYLTRNFAILKMGCSGQFGISARPCLREEDALPSEFEDELEADIEDELTVTSPPASGSFGVVPSPCREPYSQLVYFAVALTARPLRC